MGWTPEEHSDLVVYRLLYDVLARFCTAFLRGTRSSRVPFLNAFDLRTRSGSVAHA